MEFTNIQSIHDHPAQSGATTQPTEMNKQEHASEHILGIQA